MPSTSTRERVITMEAFGAKVTLLESIEACRDYADEKGASGKYHVLNQFANPDNYKDTLQNYRPRNMERYKTIHHTLCKFYGYYRHYYGMQPLFKRAK